MFSDVPLFPKRAVRWQSSLASYLCPSFCQFPEAAPKPSVNHLFLAQQRPLQLSHLSGSLLLGLHYGLLEEMTQSCSVHQEWLHPSIAFKSYKTLWWCSPLGREFLCDKWGQVAGMWPSGLKLLSRVYCNNECAQYYAFLIIPHVYITKNVECLVAVSHTFLGEQGSFS